MRFTKRKTGDGYLKNNIHIYKAQSIGSMTSRANIAKSAVEYATSRPTSDDALGWGVSVILKSADTSTHHHQHHHHLRH
uniref:HDC02198 n=1 Tax=Drosophila melanogaster TaxID=7227 RepID=Q6IHM4_DROME|nr:TPA_inf: HDC02198 [Drosophila melanogaster]